MFGGLSTKMIAAGIALLLIFAGAKYVESVITENERLKISNAAKTGIIEDVREAKETSDEIDALSIDQLIITGSEWLLPTAATD